MTKNSINNKKRASVGSWVCLWIRRDGREWAQVEKEKVIEYVSFTIWAELEYGDGPLFWNGEKWSNDQSIYSFMDEHAARWCFMDCQNDLENVKKIKLVKSIVYRDEPDIENVTLEEKEIIHE